MTECIVRNRLNKVDVRLRVDVQTATFVCAFLEHCSACNVDAKFFISPALEKDFVDIHLLIEEDNHLRVLRVRSEVYAVMKKLRLLVQMSSVADTAIEDWQRAPPNERCLRVFKEQEFGTHTLSIL